MGTGSNHKILGPERGYVEMLDEALIAADKADQLKMRKDKSPLRPSSAGECARKLAYMYREHLGLEEVVVEDRDARIVRIFDLGNHIERHILWLYKKVDGVNANVYNQQVVGVVEYDDGSLTEGSIDMCFRAGDHFGVADAKSKGDKFSKTHKSAWDEQAEAYSNFDSVVKVSDTFFWIEDLQGFVNELKDPYFAANFYQLNAYIHSEFLQRRNADHGSIIQYNKNDSRMREFRFKPSREMYDYVVKKFQTVKEKAVDKLEEIDREYKPGNVKCAFCPYNQRCWPEHDSRQAFFDTFPPKSWPKDTSRMGETGRQLEELYANFTEADAIVELAENLEDQILEIMEAEKIKKIRFKDGAVYELKWLKTPRPHTELRRSKA